jgi:pimeloyl-ACP methyl ester carboxylesterase
VQLMPGVGHALHREAPEAFTARLEQFLAELP